MSNFDRILNDACALLSDDDAQDNNWKPVAYELARRCATAEARARRYRDALEVLASSAWVEARAIARLALSPDEEERGE